MKKLLSAIVALSLAGAASAQSVEVGVGVGYYGLFSGQVVVHAPNAIDQMGVRGALSATSVLGTPVASLSAGVTYPIYREAGGLQSYVYGGASTNFGAVFGDIGVEASYPVAKDVRLTGELGATLGAGAVAKFYLGAKTTF